MKKIIKAKYIIPAFALFLIFSVIILNTNKFSDDEMDKPESYRTDKEIHFNNQRIIYEDKKEISNIEMNFHKNILSEHKNENSENIDIDKNYMNNPKNIKLKGLIEKAVKNVEGLPQYVWEPVRFTENDIDEQIAKLGKIVMYSNKVKSNTNSIEDKRILYELISNEIKNKIEFFEAFCTDLRKRSVAKNDEDQKIIDDSFNGCNEKIKELENKLNEYENEY
jgi:hypothetical protein